jgi:hypothetical protein
MCDQCGTSNITVTYFRGSRYCSACLFTNVDDGTVVGLTLRCQHCDEDIEEGASISCNACQQCENGHGFDTYAQYCEECAYEMGSDSENYCDRCGDSYVYCQDCAKIEWELNEAPRCIECDDDEATYFYCSTCQSEIQEGEEKAATTLEDGTIQVDGTSIVWTEL